MKQYGIKCLAALLALCIVSTSASQVAANLDEETIFSVKVSDMQADYGFSNEFADKLRHAKRIHRRVGCSMVKSASIVHEHIVQMAGSVISDDFAKRSHPMVQYGSTCK